MTALRRLQTHQEKVQFVQNYLNQALLNYENSRPLMIIGPGGSGKSYVLREVEQNLPLPLLVIQDGDTTLHLPSQITDDMRYYYHAKKAIILVSLGLEQDMQIAEYLGAEMVYFDRDPSLIH